MWIKNVNYFDIQIDIIIFADTHRHSEKKYQYHTI